MKRIDFRVLTRAAVFSLGVLICAGCGHKHPHDDEHSHGDHGHGDEPKTAQITVWGERHEIFAEHRLVVAGKATKFVTHVTDLQTLEPRREGTITFRLKQGDGAPVEQTEKAPTRAGIYEAMLTFPKAGDWNVAVSIPTEAGEKTVTLPPVKVYASQHDVEHAPEPEAPEGVSFLKEQQWKILSKAEPVVKRRLMERLRVAATVVARPGSMAAVTTPVAARLLPPPGRAMPMVGQQVKAGETLAVLQPLFSELAARQVEAEGEVVRSKLALEQAELALKRVQTLVKAEAKSERELQEAEFAVKTERARHEAALALRSTYRSAAETANQPAGTMQPVFELKSPITGMIVSQLGAAVGENIAADKAVFTVLDAATVFMEATVPEASVGRISTASGASYEAPGDEAKLVAITGAGGTGRLVFVSPVVEKETRTVALVFETQNPEARLRVGQQITLQIETARAEEGLAIPDAAVVEEAGNLIAYVQLSGETFEKRELKLGIRDGELVQVLAGLAEGERVVSKGAYALRLSSISGVIPAHGHAH